MTSSLAPPKILSRFFLRPSLRVGGQRTNRVKLRSIQLGLGGSDNRAWRRLGGRSCLPPHAISHELMPRHAVPDMHAMLCHATPCHATPLSTP